MVRHAAALLVIVMLAASGRLLACSWECLDEIAAAEASCHSTAAPSVAIEGGPAHECPPEAAEIPVMAAKKDSSGLSAIAISAAAIVRPLAPHAPPLPPVGRSRLAARSPAVSVSVLRI